EAARGPAIDPAKGYRVEPLGAGAYLVTEGVYQMLLVVAANGVIAVDAPPSIGAKISQAVAEVAPGKRLTHLVERHANLDHIGYAGELLKPSPGLKLVAHQEPARLLARARDPRRPVPTTRFDGVGKPFELVAGGQSLELVYPGPNHEPGNIEIRHAKSRTL